MSDPHSVQCSVQIAPAPRSTFFISTHHNHIREHLEDAYHMCCGLTANAISSMHMHMRCAFTGAQAYLCDAHASKEATTVLHLLSPTKDNSRDAEP